MEEFLQETKHFLGTDDKIHVVIGNESCDLDSVVAALTYGYFLHKTSSSSQTRCLPVLNTPKSQFHLRTDSKYLLGQTGINPDHLTFKDDLDLQDLHLKGRLTLTLVDHNVLAGEHASLEDSVVMVIDHHQLERKPCDRVKVVLDMVGSCCTLVAGIMLDCPEFSLSPQIATMLIGTILVDTINTSPEAGKTTPYDQEILGRLMQAVPDLDRDKLFNQIQEAKNDVSALTTQEVLEKDLKCVTHSNQTVVMSSIPVSLETFLQRFDVKEALNAVMHGRNGQSVVVMTMHIESGAPEREILLFSHNEEELKKLAEFLISDKDVQLDLQPLTCDLKYSFAYRQGNVKASRKKVLPLVKSFLQTTCTIPQDELLLNFDPMGSNVSASALVDFSADLSSPSVPTNLDKPNTNQNLLFDPIMTDNANANSTANQELLGLFDSSTPSQKQPKISVTLPKSPEGGFTAGSTIHDLLGDFTESDVMESPLRTPDLMQSLSEASSGPGSTANSRPGSEFPSHTVTPPETGTPPNSLISSGFNHPNNEFTLPSMNNAETIEKIHQKKQQMMSHGITTSRLRGDSTDSCPYTPHNSVADFQFDAFAKEHSLRTLNNSQMVRDVEQKRKSLGGEVDLVSSSTDQEKAENVPFTPCNSFVSEQFGDLYNRDSSLRSLNNAEIVQQIQEKRASMSGIASTALEEGEEENEEECTEEKKMEEDDGEEDVVPFTPQNSFMESNLDRLAKEHNLPSLNNADMVLRVQQKRSSLGNMMADLEEGKVMSPDAEGEDGDLEQSYSPFTPQNSFVESHMEKYGRHGLDMNSLNDRLLGIGQDKSVINPLVPNLLDFDPLSGTPENVVAKGIAQEMLKDNQENSVNDLLDLNFGDQEDENGDGSGGSDGTGNHGKSSGIMGKNDSQRAQQDGSQSSETSPNTDSGPVDDVAFSLAGKLIEHVLDNFEPSDLLVDTAESNEAVIVPVPTETKKQEEQAVEVKSQGPQSLMVPDSSTDVKKVPSSGQLLGLETDYLSKVDLFHGNYDLMSNQGNQEVVESSSFRKISGEAPQTVREEILDSISRESFDRSRAGEEGYKDITENGIEEENEGMMEEIKEDRKIEEGMSKAGGVKEEEKVKTEGQKDKVEEQESDLTQTEGEEEVTESEIERTPSESDGESSSSPTQHVARELLDTVIKNAVEIVQSEMEEETASANLRKPKLPSQSIFNFDTTDDMEESGSSPSDGSSPTTTEASYRLSSPDLTEGANNSGVIGMVSSGLSIGSISSESLSSYTGFKSDVNLDQTGRSMASMGSISNESLSSYSHVKSDMNLEDLTPENKEKVNNPTSGKGKLEVENLKVKTKVIFKVDSFTDDNLDENTDKVKVREKEKVKEDSESKKEVYMTTAGRISIKVDDEALMSDFSPSKGQAVMSSVTEESSLVTSSQSNEGLPLMSVSSDPFESVDSIATVTEDEKEVLEENKKNPSDDMTESDSKLKDRLGGLDLADEWQEDDIPGMPPAENVSDDSSDSEGSRSRHSSNSSHSSTENPRVRNSSLSAHPKRKITANFSILSDDLEDDGMDPADGLEWENDTPIKQTDPLPEFSAREEYNEAKLWKGVEIGGKTMKIDLKVIEPYKKVLSHGGYYGDGLNAIIIFSGCYLPDRSRRDYQYVMDNLFMYVISTLETLVAEDYMIVYFHGATPRRQMPSFGWLKRCYQMIDRRLRKNLKSLLLVHPTLWLRTIVMMTRPFISAKFSSKLRFVRSLSELGQIIPMEYIFVPELVQQYDDRYLQPHTTPDNSPLSHSPEPLTSSS